MSTRPQPPYASGAEDVENDAAQWLVRRQSGLTEADAERFSLWLEADPRHRAAFAELDAAWTKLTFPQRVGQGGEVKRQLAARARQRRRLRLAAAGAALLVVLGGMVALQPKRFLSQESTVMASSVTPRPNVQTLPDGTRVELNANAEIEVEFTAEERAVRLVRGEALFSVTKDPARPFVVSAGEVAVRAVGTAFAVRHGAANVGVLVTEGRVAVERTRPAVALDVARTEPILVSVGGKVDWPADPTRAPVIAPTVLSATEIAAELAWRGHRVEFSRTTLADAVALFNRRNHVQLAIKDANIARITISGIFWADNPESFVRLLESGFSIQAARTGNRIVLREK